MRAHIYLTHPIPNTRSNLQLYESGGPEGVVFCRKASNSFSTGHSLNPRKQYITRLKIGTSIVRDRMFGYPALEKIFQAGTMPRPPTINITSHNCPAINRTESVDWRKRVNRFGSPVAEVPVKWTFSRKASRSRSVEFGRG